MVALQRITMATDAAAGYSGSDLTAAGTAVSRNEVPYLRSDASGQSVGAPVLELRIHGVGGAPPEQNLESPSTVLMSGDASAGFYRPWFPGGSPAVGQPTRLEAYCWGKLTYGATSRAAWLLLIPFAVVNLAHWTLPRTAASRAWHTALATREAGIPVPSEPTPTSGFSRALLRLIGLVLTATFTGTVGYVLVDLIAWQAVGAQRLPAWAGLYSGFGPGPRMAIALLACLAVLSPLFILSYRSARANDRWDAGQAAKQMGFELSEPTLWRRNRTLARQRDCHIGIAAATLLGIGAMPTSSVNGLRIAILVLAAAVALAAAVLVMTRWADRISPDDAVGHHARLDAAVRIGAYSTVAAVGTLALSRVGWRPSSDSPDSLPGSFGLQNSLVLAEFGLAAVLILWIAGHRPWRSGAPFVRGFTGGILPLLGVCIATVFGSSVVITITNLLGKPATDNVPDADLTTQALVLPKCVYAGGAGFGFTMIFALIAGTWMLLKRRRLTKRYLKPGNPFGVALSYAGRTPAEGGSDGAAASVAKTWATSRLTDYGPAAISLITLATTVGVLGYLADGTANEPKLEALTSLANLGSLAAVAITAAFLVYLRSAIASPDKRKLVSTFWDVVTFWPRAAHPLGPPSYPERSVPEVVTRVRRIVGSAVGDETDPALAQERTETSAADGAIVEEHSPVLISGYSQGGPIAAAVVAQLGSDTTGSVALLTLATPLHRLYGRAFPVWFGDDQLLHLRAALTVDPVCRWISLYRRTDYIGGRIGHQDEQPPATPTAVLGSVDQEVFDPPVLWPGTNPAPPPRHLHSDWFPDPQTRPAAESLATTLVARWGVSAPVAYLDWAGAAAEKSWSKVSIVS